jgi:hypothetical protein
MSLNTCVNIANNIIAFPKPTPAFSGSDPQTLDNAHQSIRELREFYVDSVQGIIMENVIDGLHLSGYQVIQDGDPHNKDLAFVFAALRSLMLKIKGLDHPFQKIADDIFEDLGDGIVELKLGETDAP